MESITFEGNKPVTAVLDSDKLKVSRLIADKIFNDLAKKYKDSEHSELYFYSIIAIYERCQNIISGIGAEGMKQGLEL